MLTGPGSGLQGQLHPETHPRPQAPLFRTLPEGRWVQKVAPMPKISLLFLSLLAVSLFASAYGGSESVQLSAEAIEIEATPEFVLVAAHRTQTSSYAFDMSMRMNMDTGFMAMKLEGNDPLATGVFDGDLTSIHMDMGVMFRELVDSEPMFEMVLDQMGDPDDLVMNMIVDPSDMYINAPLLRAAGGLVPGLAPAINGWGRIDLAAATGLDSAALASLGGASTADPASVLDLVESIGAEVVEVGTDNIHGVETTRFVTSVRLGDLLSSQDGFSDLLNGAGGHSFPAGTSMDIGVTMNFFDHNNVDRITIPAHAVDVTSAFVELARAGSL
jgi:hypothetical protein